jgi:hypothetical protein
MQALGVPDGLVQHVEILGRLLGDVVGSFVQVNAVHIQTLNAVVLVPASIELDLAEDLRQGLLAVVNPHIPHRAHVGKLVQLGHFSDVVIAWEWAATRSTVRVHDHEEVGAGVGRNPVWCKDGCVSGRCTLLAKSNTVVAGVD